jgi:hypothetical protein
MRSRSLLRILAAIVLAAVLNVQLFGQSDKAWSRRASKVVVEPNQAAKPGHTKSVKFSSIIRLRNLPPMDSPDVSVTPLTNTTQSENSIAVSPLNPNIVLNSNNSSDYPVTQIYGASGFTSTDGGLTWYGSVQGTGGTNSGDPAVGIARSGRFHNGYIAANGGNGAAYSTDNGVTWTNVQVYPNPGSLADKNHLWVDISPSSPYVNNVYASWTDFGGANDAEIMIARSTNGGVSWSSAQNISSAVAAGSHNQGVNIQTGPNGEVYVCWAIYDSWPSLETAIGFAKSTDGGVTYSTAVRAITNIKGIRSQATGGGLLGGKDMRTATFPSMTVNPQNGHMWITWANIGVPGTNTGTERDVWVSKSTDGGATWQTAVRVNQDAFNNGKDQWFPWIACDPTSGALVCAFYDSRDFASNDQANTYVAISRDGGATWEDFRVSDASWSGDGSGTGFSANYAGDYIGIAVRDGKVYPVWTDRRAAGNRLNTWVSPFLLADPTDPNPVTGLTAYSDYLTPTSILLDWNDPTTLANGDPIDSFVVDIYRNSAFVTSVPKGAETYNNTGLTDGTLYDYDLYVRLIPQDSLSPVASVSWYAGGSPFPAAPANLMATGDTVHAALAWDDPTTQSDGTPLDDLAKIFIYRNDVLIDSVNPGVEVYQDSPPQGFVYTYKVVAVDNETPRHLSAASNTATAYVGYTPAYLVWVGPDAAGASAASGDSLFAMLVANGESAYLTNNLFEFGTDLSIYDGIFVVLGVYSNNHVLEASDPEGPALQTYLQNGGRMYLEGADCFNYDPGVGGYNIQPWFGLIAGPDGGSDVAGIIGQNDLAAFSFAYTGENSFMDELVPSGSTVVWKNDANTDNSGVFYVGYSGGSGRSIGVVPSFGGLVNSTLAPVLAAKSNGTTVRTPRKIPVHAAPFVKRAAYYPELKHQRKPLEQLVTYSKGGLKILANNKRDLMAAYIGLFWNTGEPTIDVSVTSISDTLLVGGSRERTFTITNSGGSLAGDLVFSIAENPAATWLSVAPTADTLSGNQQSTITVTLDASSLTAGNYNTTLEISSNDTANPLVTVAVSLRVDEAPSISVFPDSLFFDLFTDELDSATYVIRNTGTGPLVITAIEAEEISTAVIRPPQPQQHTVRLPKGAEEPVFPPITLDQGGPDPFGYRWIDSDEPGGPAFSWYDISTIGTPITGWSPSSDDGAVQIPLPFSFPFYGNSYSAVRVVTNGWIGFDLASTSVDYFNVAIPDVTEPNDALYAFWDDLDLSSGGSVHYYYDAANARFIVQWTNVPHYSSGGPYTFQVMLYTSGKILYQYLTMNAPDNSATIGIENADGTIATQIVYDATYVHNNLAIRISRGVTWMTQTPTGGTVAPGDSLTIKVNVDATDLVGGTYRAHAVISNNDPLNPSYGLPIVTLGVTGVPDICVEPEELDYGTIFTGQTDTLDFDVTNCGTDVLTVSSMTHNSTKFTLLGSTSFVLGVGEVHEVRVVFSSATVGTFMDTVTIASDGASGTKYVDLIGSAIAPPVVTVSDTVIDGGQLQQGSEDSTSFWIFNDGLSDLHFNIREARDPFPTLRPMIWEGGTLPGPSYPGPSSIDRAPHLGTSSGSPAAAVTGDFNAYGVDAFGGWYVRWDLQNPTGMLNIAPVPIFIDGADWSQNGSTLYAINREVTPNQFGVLDTATGAFTPIGNMSSGGEGFTDLTVDPTTGVIYASGYLSPNSYLYTVDPSTGAATQVGLMNGVSIVIGLAADNDGQLYAYDVGNDLFYGIDKTTGGATAIGAIGFDANYAQSLEFDPNDNTCYMAAFNNVAFAGELRIVDVSTGATSLVGNLGTGTGVEVCGFGVASLGLNWVDVSPTSGTIAAGDSANIKVYWHGILTAVQVLRSGYLGIGTNDPVTPMTNVHVLLDVLVGVENPQLALPTEYALHPNFPNPFNPSTTIKYDLKEAGKVSLKIYNVLGQEVRTLVSGAQTAGFKNIAWDGRNNAGQAVSSGIYVYRLETSGFVKSRKMMLLK